MEREKGSLQVVRDGRKGIVLETASNSTEVKVRWEDGTEEWITLTEDSREQASEIPPREIGS